MGYTASTQSLKWIKQVPCMQLESNTKHFCSNLTKYENFTQIIMINSISILSCCCICYNKITRLMKKQHKTKLFSTIFIMKLHISIVLWLFSWFWFAISCHYPDTSADKLQLLREIFNHVLCLFPFIWQIFPLILWMCHHI